MEVLPFIMLLWIHYVADFLLQTDNMAIKKSSCNRALSAHCVVYTLPMFVIGWQFAIINGASHFCIDYVTSRINSKLWAAEKRGAFFNMIGADQAIHLTILFISYSYFK